MEAEEALPGGNMTLVVRTGATVRRASGPWTPLVHRLLGTSAGQRHSGSAGAASGSMPRGREKF